MVKCLMVDKTEEMYNAWKQTEEERHTPRPTPKLAAAAAEGATAQ
jgi:hypothetical protein